MLSKNLSNQNCVTCMFLFPSTRPYCDSALSAKQYVAKIFSQLWQFAPGGQRLAMNSIQISKTQLASLYGLCVKILFVEIFCVAFWRLGDYEQLNLSIKYFLLRRKDFPCTRKWSGDLLLSQNPSPNFASEINSGVGG